MCNRHRKDDKSHLQILKYISKYWDALYLLSDWQDFFKVREGSGSSAQWWEGFWEISTCDNMSNSVNWHNSF